MKEVEYAEDVGGIESMKYRRVPKQKEGRDASTFPCTGFVEKISSIRVAASDTNRKTMQPKDGKKYPALVASGWNLLLG